MPAKRPDDTIGSKQSEISVDENLSTIPTDENQISPDAEVVPEGRKYRAYDYVNKEEVDIPESLLEESLKSGRFGLEKGAQIEVVNPNGQRGTISAEEAEDAFKTGFKLYNEEMRTEDVKEEKYGDKPLQSFTTALASGMSLGLSDQALVKSGIYSQEELREIRERSPDAATTGEITGFLAPLLASGGSALLAKGGAKTASQIAAKGAAASKILPAGLANQAGQAVEKLTGKVVEKVIAKEGKKRFVKELLAKSIPMGLGGATEGALYGAGKLISEDALGRADLNAENLIAYSTTGALFGGLVGGGAGAAFATLKAGKDFSAGTLFPLVKKYSKDMLHKHTDKVEASLDLLGIKTPAAAAKFKEVNKSVLQELPDFIATKGKLQLFDSSKSLYDNIHTVKQKALESISNVVSHVDEVLKKNNINIPANEVYNNTLKRLDSFLDQYKNNPYVKKEFKPALKLRDDLIKRINSTKPSSTTQLVSDEVFGPRLQTVTSRPANRITGKELHEFRKQLDDTIDYGNPEKSILNKAKIELRDALSDEFMRVTQLSDNILSGAEYKLYDQLKQANKDYSISTRVLPYLNKKVEADMAKKLFTFTDFILGIASAATGNPAFATVAGAKKFLESDFKNRLVVLSTIDQAKKHVNDTISASLNSYFKLGDLPPGLSKAVTKITPISLSNTVLNLKGEKPKKTENKTESIIRIGKELNELMRDPAQLGEHLTRRTSGIAKGAPTVAQQVEQAGMRAIQFLDAKVPRSQTTQTDLQPDLEDFKPNSIEIAKFERYVQGVIQPLSVVQDLKEGKINREGVEAVKTVYPELYKEIQQQVMDKIGQLKTKLPYRKRLELGILLEIPTDPSLQSENLLGLQEMFQVVPALRAEKQAGIESRQDKVRGKILSGSGIGKRSATDLEKAQNRK